MTVANFATLDTDFLFGKGSFSNGIGDSIYNKNLSLSLKSRRCKSNMW